MVNLKQTKPEQKCILRIFATFYAEKDLKGERQYKDLRAALTFPTLSPSLPLPPQFVPCFSGLSGGYCLSSMQHAGSSLEWEPASHGKDRPMGTKKKKVNFEVITC